MQFKFSSGQITVRLASLIRFPYARAPAHTRKDFHSLMKYLNLSFGLGGAITDSILAIEVMGSAHPAIISPPVLKHENTENTEYFQDHKLIFNLTSCQISHKN